MQVSLQKPKMITRNEYFRYITETGKFPKDNEMEILPLDLSAYKLSDVTVRIADKNFMEESTDRNGKYLLRGHWLSDLSYQFITKCNFIYVPVSGYQSYAYSDKQLAIFTYTEGDITLQPFETEEEYLEEKERTIKFYKEEI